MSKFTDNASEKLLVVAGKISNQKHMASIKNAFYTLMPVILTGAFCTLISNVVCSTTTTGISLAKLPGMSWLGMFTDLFNAANYATLNFFTVAAVFLIGMELAKQNGLGDSPDSGVVAVCSFISVLPTYVVTTVNDVQVTVPNVLGKDYTAARGLFLGMVIALVSVEIYFEKMIDACRAAGVEPMICLEHYELPGELFTKYGGWGSKHVVDLFVRYAEAAFQRFGSKVRYWFAFNEPVVVQTRVYLDSERWPFEQNSQKWMDWNYNKALATNRVMKLFKEGGYRQPGGKFGTIINVEMAYPRSNSAYDREAAEMYDLFYNKVFLDPAIKGAFQPGFFDLLESHGIHVDATPEELKDIKENTMDWVGLNLYHPNRVKGRTTAVNPKAPFHPNFYYEEWDMPGRRMNPFRGWEIGPEIMYDMGIRMRDEYGNMPWFISESGMGVENEQRYRDESGIIQDDYRIDFIKEHLDCAIRAAKEGCNCQGYMLWAFTDNVSPRNAFKNRYGLVEIDLEHNRDRHLKKSAFFYKQTIEQQSFDLEDDSAEYR